MYYLCNFQKLNDNVVIFKSYVRVLQTTEYGVGGIGSAFGWF